MYLNGYSGRQILIRQVDRVLLPVLGQGDGADGTGIRISVLAGNSADLEFRNLLAAFFAAHPKRQALIGGQVITAGLFSPVIGGMLPENAGPVGALRGLPGVSDLDAGLSVGRIRRIPVVDLQIPIIPHPTGWDIMVHPSAFVRIHIEDVLDGCVNRRLFRLGC